MSKSYKFILIFAVAFAVVAIGYFAFMQKAEPQTATASGWGSDNSASTSTAANGNRPTATAIKPTAPSQPAAPANAQKPATDRNAATTTAAKPNDNLMDRVNRIKDAASQNTSGGEPPSVTIDVQPATTTTAVSAPTTSTMPTNAQPAPVVVSTATAPVRSTPQTYTIQQGDTLSSIAVKLYGSAHYWEQIALANGTNVDPQRLRIGQVIRLPDANALTARTNTTGVTPPPPGSGRVHIVRAGETLSTIANQHYGEPEFWRLIYQHNRADIGANPDVVQAGMRLIIPPAPR